MTDRELMQQALEALQKIYIAPEHEEYIRVWWPACEDAITALRERLAQPEQMEQPEPDGLSWLKKDSNYFSQPKRKPWVGLTDKRITQVIDSMPNKFAGFMVDWDLYEFTRAIEAAHGIKENT